jgi:hypothetical protein
VSAYVECVRYVGQKTVGVTEVHFATPDQAKDYLLDRLLWGSTNGYTPVYEPKRGRLCLKRGSTGVGWVFTCFQGAEL